MYDWDELARELGLEESELEDLFDDCDMDIEDFIDDWDDDDYEEDDL